MLADQDSHSSSFLDLNRTYYRHSTGIKLDRPPSNLPIYQNYTPVVREDVGALAWQVFTSNLALFGKYILAFGLPILAACLASFFPVPCCGLLSITLLNAGSLILGSMDGSHVMDSPEQAFHHFRRVAAPRKFLAILLKGLAIGGTLALGPAYLAVALFSIGFGLIALAVTNQTYLRDDLHKWRQEAIGSAATQVSMASLVAVTAACLIGGALDIPSCLLLFALAGLQRCQFFFGAASLLNIHRHEESFIYDHRAGWQNAASLALGLLWLV